MSAIAGIVKIDNGPVSNEHSRSIMKSLEIFPADDVQTWENEGIFLGCHAQWITPESIGERLPFYDEEKKLALTADAIIDNRDELFERLQVSNEKRKTITDSELILLSYHKWGEQSPKYLIGDFAFIIWDERNRQLFAARDFSGGRTLYYVRNDHQFAFCTTIQPLLTLPFVERKLSEKWIAEYLAIPGMNDTVDTSITPYACIEQLPPSHTIKIANGEVKLSRYLTLRQGERLRLKSNDEYIEAFQDVFQTAINSRLRTYRNVGAHLSGGLDSGAIASFAARALPNKKGKLYTYSYIPSKDFIDWTSMNRVADETPYIKTTVKYVGNIKDYYLDFGEVNPLLEINDWLGIMEMPYKFFANSNWIKGIYEKAQEHEVGVLLNGGRGNLSISWGPALNYYATLLKKLKLYQLYNELDHYSKNVGGNRLRMLPVLGKIAFPSLNKMLTSVETYKFPTLINSELAKRTGVFKTLKEYGINVERTLYGDNVYEVRKKHFEQVYPWNTTGTIGSKLSLYNSLWKRDPTNDLRVIRFCLSIPEEQYVQNGLDRALIRRSTVNLLPDKVRLNQKVRGAQGADYIYRMTPVWNEFINELEKLCIDPLITEFINTQVVKAGISKVRNGPRPEYAFDPDFWILVRSLILYRFIKNFS